MVLFLDVWNERVQCVANLPSISIGFGKYRSNDATKRDQGERGKRGELEVESVGEGDVATAGFIKLTGCSVSAGGSMRTNRRNSCQILETRARATVCVLL